MFQYIFSRLKEINFERRVHRGGIPLRLFYKLAQKESVRAEAEVMVVSSEPRLRSSTISGRCFVPPSNRVTRFPTSGAGRPLPSMYVSSPSSCRLMAFLSPLQVRVPRIPVIFRVEEPCVRYTSMRSPSRTAAAGNLMVRPV